MGFKISSITRPASKQAKRTIQGRRKGFASFDENVLRSNRLEKNVKKDPVLAGLIIGGPAGAVVAGSVSAREQGKRNRRRIREDADLAFERLETELDFALFANRENLKPIQAGVRAGFAGAGFESGAGTPALVQLENIEQTLLEADRLRTQATAVALNIHQAKRNAQKARQLAKIQLGIAIATGIVSVAFPGVGTAAGAVGSAAVARSGQFRPTAIPTTQAGFESNPSFATVNRGGGGVIV